MSFLTRPRVITGASEEDLIYNDPSCNHEAETMGVRGSFMDREDLAIFAQQEDETVGATIASLRNPQAGSLAFARQAAADAAHPNESLKERLDREVTERRRLEEELGQARALSTGLLAQVEDLQDRFHERQKAGMEDEEEGDEVFDGTTGGTVAVSSGARVSQLMNSPLVHADKAAAARKSRMTLQSGHEVINMATLSTCWSNEPILDVSALQGSAPEIRKSVQRRRSRTEDPNVMRTRIYTEEFVEAAESIPWAAEDAPKAPDVSASIPAASSSATPVGLALQLPSRFVRHTSDASARLSELEAKFRESQKQAERARHELFRRILESESVKKEYNSLLAESATQASSNPATSSTPIQLDFTRSCYEQELQEQVLQLQGQVDDLVAALLRAQNQLLGQGIRDEEVDDVLTRSATVGGYRTLEKPTLSEQFGLSDAKQEAILEGSVGRKTPRSRLCDDGPDSQLTGSSFHMGVVKTASGRTKNMIQEVPSVDYPHMAEIDEADAMLRAVSMSSMLSGGSGGSGRSSQAFDYKKPSLMGAVLSEVPSMMHGSVTMGSSVKLVVSARVQEEGPSIAPREDSSRSLLQTDYQEKGEHRTEENGFWSGFMGAFGYGEDDKHHARLQAPRPGHEHKKVNRAMSTGSQVGASMSTGMMTVMSTGSQAGATGSNSVRSSAMGTTSTIKIVE